MGKEAIKTPTKPEDPRRVLPPKAGSAIHQDHADNYWTLRNKLFVASIAISAVSICFSAVSLGLAVWALTKSIENQRQSIANQRDLKGIDLLVTFQKRYDELAYDVRSKVDSDEKATEYYHRFWDLQFEQYQYWKLGMIQPEIYGSWMEFRRQEFVRNYKIRNVTFQEGWLEGKNYLFAGDPKRSGYYKEFADFMDGVFRGEDWRYKPPNK